MPNTSQQQPGATPWGLASLIIKLIILLNELQESFI